MVGDIVTALDGGQLHLDPLHAGLDALDLFHELDVHWSEDYARLLESVVCLRHYGGIGFHVAGHCLVPLPIFDLHRIF